ncbi:MAG TPA: nucleoside triphosphate pyrophosphohydrolase [Coriobacteriia bacterium]
MGSIAIVGLREDAETLPGPALERVRQADTVIVPSPEGAAARLAVAAGVTPVSYAELGLPPEVSAEQLVSAVSTAASSGDVVLLSASFPLMRGGVVSGLLERLGGDVDVLPVVSPLEVLLLAFDGDLTADVDIVDAHGLRNWHPQRGTHLVVTGVENRMLARAVSGRLGEAFSPEHRVVLADRRESGGFDLAATTVAGLAEVEEACRDRAVYVPPSHVPPPDGFYELVRIMSILRDPEGGCPWDLEQTHMSIRGHLIEEAYEAVTAIEELDDASLADELGDILLQVVFHAQMAAEAGSFTIDDATAGIVAKLRRRHPHIFGSGQATTPAEVLHQWEAIKREEKPGVSVLASVPHALPALLRAQKISKKAAATGFDWETVEDVWEKVHEEIEELKATDPGTQEAADEVGDVLFSVVNVARKLGVDAESALRVTCDRFSARFSHMEAAAAASGRNLADMDIDAMEALWRQAKAAGRGQGPLSEAASSRPPDGGS